MSRIEQARFAAANAWIDFAAPKEYDRILEYSLHRMKLGREAVKNDPLRKLKFRAVKYRRLVAGVSGAALGLTSQGVMSTENFTNSLPILGVLSLVAFGINWLLDHWMQIDIDNFHNIRKR